MVKEYLKRYKNKEEEFSKNAHTSQTNSDNESTCNIQEYISDHHNNTYTQQYDAGTHEDCLLSSHTVTQVSYPST